MQVKTTSASAEAVNDHRRALGRNVLLKNVAESSRLFQMAFFVVIARRFGAGNLGKLTVLLMVGSVVGLICGDLGLNTTVIARMNAMRGRARERLAASALACKVVLSVVSLALMLLAMRIALRFGDWTEILAVAVISCGSIWHEFFAALTNGVNRLESEAWLRLLYRGAVYGGGSLICFFCGLGNVLVYMSIAAAVVLASGFVALHKYLLPLTISSNLRIAISLLRHAAPVWITQIAQLTYLKLDVVILGFLHVAAREIGWYAAAWKIVDVLTTIPAFLAGATLPLLSGALPETKIIRIASGYLKAMYVLPFFIVLPLAIGASFISRLLYGSTFSATAGVLSILVWAIIPISVHSFLALVSVATRRQYEVAKLGAASAVLGLLAALVAVPAIGYQAMAVVSLVVNSLFAVILVYRFRNVTSSAHLPLALKSSAGALASYVVCMMIAAWIPAPLLILAAIGFYFVALLISGVLTLQDLTRGWRLIGAVL